MSHNCNMCNTQLIAGENITQNRLYHHQYLCRTCKNKWQNEYRSASREQRLAHDREYHHRIGRNQPMDENRECSSFLGVYIAEQVLIRTFKTPKQMPYGTPGYDFVCGNGFKIDVKSSCRNCRDGYSDSWIFVIRKNIIADYFICMAFDNRQDLNPEHIWLIPGSDISDHVSISISESTLHKWDKYRVNIDKVVSCCNEMKEHTN